MAKQASIGYTACEVGCRKLHHGFGDPDSAGSVRPRRMNKIVVFRAFHASYRPPGGLASRGRIPAHAERFGRPRVLLRRLRETMAEKVSAQERLDKIVVLIAANMVAEVCSCYVLRIDNTLELYATEGLNRDAVHRTVLNAHEGLVGLVSSEASPLNLSDAQSHPAFSFRPGNRRRNLPFVPGVPILRAGNTLGVLVVQNRAKRTYVEEEVEALQTTAMVLAE